MMNVLMVIKTDGLAYDDRLRKECRTLRDLNCSPKILVLETLNRGIAGITEEGIPFYSIALWTRKIFPHRNGLALKTCEMYIRFFWRIFLEHPQVVWLHNVEMAGLIPTIWLMKEIRILHRIIWDQHELPPSVTLKYKIFQSAFKILISLCDAIIVANTERRNFLISSLGRAAKKFYVIENFADESFINLPRGILPGEVESWLQGHSYFLAQGGASPKRYLEKLCEAIVKDKTAKLVVVGPYKPEKVRWLRTHLGEQFFEWVYFTGPVPQMTLVNFIDSALASVVLYDQNEENNRLCAPNRLYQALARGVPVLVGSNPPMEKVVQYWDCGVVLNGDGSSVEDIQFGMRTLLARHNAFRKNATICRSKFDWNSQAAYIRELTGIAGSH